MWKSKETLRREGEKSVYFKCALDKTHIFSQENLPPPFHSVSVKDTLVVNGFFPLRAAVFLH